MLERLSPPPRVAYFSMEAGLESAMPTYSGGLGVLAGDTLRAAADLGVPMVAVTLLHRQGYFRQRLEASGEQIEEPYPWEPSRFLEPLDILLQVTVEGRQVALRPWRYTVKGVSGHTVPVFFLDAALPQNDPRDRALTGQLYGGDERYRLAQEALLGFGGIALLEALGCRDIQTYHMNEGHSALITLALLEAALARQGSKTPSPADFESVRSRCVFTTHTPVPAGHDRFPMTLVEEVLGEARAAALRGLPFAHDGTLNMTFLALFFSRYVNGVALRHGEVSQAMYPGYRVHAITNGVHAATWTSQPFQDLFDREVPEWRRDNAYLRYAVAIPVEQIMEAHARAKQALLAEVRRRTGVVLDATAMTIGFARRAATYKRAALLFSDPDRLKAIARDVGPIQLVFGGKAHPRDEAGQALIRRVFEGGASVKPEIQFVYLEEHDMALGKLLCSGTDLWLNNPQKPQEASGTSGMKAALNGVPSLSVLDGWWVEGWVEGVTGWAIGDESDIESDSASEAWSLYNKLRYVILPLFYDRPQAYGRVMRSTIALNGSFFNAQRMMEQYVENAYRLGSGWRFGNHEAEAGEMRADVAR
ncbi:MAG TPA: alpha-glucan family phosphorylase [Dehalococcoidia bacterium]|nr:alpha-glucan family phosphorylase [Dehalococcoidia bacterium]